MIRFILNDQLIATEFSSGSTVLDYVRYHKRLTGTKIGCREGDCGACTILVGDFEPGVNGGKKLVYRSMTSCLMPLGNAHGKHIVSVEGINMPSTSYDKPQLSPVQQAMVDTNGTQCGFCTIGFVMSLTGFVLNDVSRNYEQAIAAIDGNICRCTGYKSIERAATILSEKMDNKPAEETIEWLVQNNFVPDYFTGIEKRLLELRVFAGHAEYPDGNMKKVMVVAGGTDLVVQRSLAVKRAEVEHVFDAGHLKGISLENGCCHVGASVTVTEFAESKLIQGFFPDLDTTIKLISSTPIRNMATMAGNLVNASPIGDMSIFFLALDSELQLNKGGQTRTIKLRNFYKAYKQIDKEEDEIIEKIIFIPPQNKQFSFEKVCKRTHLDIASVNSACQVSMEEDGTIRDIHFSAGGVAPFPKYLAGTATYLKDKKFTEETISGAIEIMNTEIAPISDARGTEAYKRLLLRQLFLAHVIKFTGSANAVKNILHG